MCKCTHTRHRDRLQLTTKRNHHVERQIQQTDVGVAPGCAQFGSSVCEADNRPDGEGDGFFFHLLDGEVDTVS